MKKTFLYAALAMMLAACSNDDTLQNGSAETDGMVPVTLSVTADNSVITRADGDGSDPAPTRCFVQIFTTTDNGKTLTPAAGDLTNVQNMEPNDADGTFSLNGIYLHPTTDYVFLYWADNGSGADPTDLRAVSYAKGNIAFAKCQAWRYDGTNAAISERLTHAVAKVTLKTTTDLDASSNISVALQHCYDTYDVSTGAVSGESSDKTFSTTVSTDITGSDDGAEVFSFYALTGESTQTVNIKNGNNNDDVSNVPLGPDKHTTLVGDVRNLGLTPVTFTASIDENWGSNETVNFPTHDINNDGDITIESGTHYIVGSGEPTSNTITINGTAEVHLKGVNISGANGPAISITGGSPTIKVSGENSVASSNNSGIGLSNGASVTIEGVNGTDDVLTATANTPSGHTTTIGAGIGNVVNGTAGDITIQNVTVTAKGTNDSGGSIGGGAGIGTSCGGTCGDIIIMNATVTATGGRYAAGIGLGGNNDNTNHNYITSMGAITITGSDITATAGDNAAAIGFPSSNYGGTYRAGAITIMTDENYDTFIGKLHLNNIYVNSAYKIGKGRIGITTTSYFYAPGNGTNAWSGVSLTTSDKTFTNEPDGIGD